ncbi:hypothetical protein ACFL2O_10810 [Thermodesulfobacteriota bacterium]
MKKFIRIVALIILVLLINTYFPNSASSGEIIVRFETGYTANFKIKGQSAFRIRNMNGYGSNVDVLKTYFDAIWKGSNIQLKWKDIKIVEFVGNSYGNCPREFWRNAKVTFRDGREANFGIKIDFWIGNSDFGNWGYSYDVGHPEIRNVGCARWFANINELESIEFTEWGN